ncbi:MAG: hypothetical protein IIX67_04875 [Clostridia bacterium]|nr:hypothetical protein [Clostridia bacterium]
MIHQYKLNGYNIVLDICSGAVHAVDDIAYDIISMYQDESKERIIDAMCEKYLGRASDARGHPRQRGARGHAGVCQVHGA